MESANKNLHAILLQWQSQKKYYENQKTVPSTVLSTLFWQLETHMHILMDLHIIILHLHFLVGEGGKLAVS